jgi:hypothetical protein
LNLDEPKSGRQLDVYSIPRPPKEPVHRTSALLSEFAASWQGERVYLRELWNVLGNRSFGFLLFLFAIPNSLPIIGVPGVSSVTGIPLLLLSAQMIMGLPQPYLPKWLGNRSIATADLQQVVQKIAPLLAKIERLTRPRLLWMSGTRGERVMGVASFLFAFVLALPIPFGNLLPGLSLLLIGFGLIERDGLCIVAGLTIGIVTMFILTGAVWAFLLAASSAI